MSNITIVNDAFEATYITHGGMFHGDEVFATVILSKVAELQGKDFKLARVLKVPEGISKEVIVYDIGLSDYDHHQQGGNGLRKNEVPYAACGLIWRKFGNFLTADSVNPEMVWGLVDSMLIQGVDARDNGVIPKLDYQASELTVSNIISMSNPLWDSCESSDEAFLKAVKHAEHIFDIVMDSAKAKARAENIIAEAVENSKDGIMVLERFAPWQAGLLNSENPKAKDILFVVFPSNRGGYNWQGVPDALGSFTLRKASPKEWHGKSAEELKNLTGVATAHFCHNTGFLGATETLEDAIMMARLAIKA